MALTISERCQMVRQSEIRNMTIQCASLGGINLAQGVCDLTVPDPVIDGAERAMRNGINSYTRYDGLEAARKAISQSYAQRYGMDVDPEGEVVISAGTTGAFHVACLALMNPGDEFLLPEPFYGYHLGTLAAAGVKPVLVPSSSSDFGIHVADLEAHVTPKTKAMMVCTPSNPTGRVLSEQEIADIGAFCEKHDLFLFTDEIYESFVYDGRKHVPPATVPGLEDRTITISGVSKAFSVTGWRIGWCVAPKEFAEPMGHFNDLVYVCAPAPLQMGAAAGLSELGPDYYDRLSRQFQEKRGRFCQALAEAGFTPHVPQGAYYVLADMSAVPGADSKQKAMAFLEKTGVACVPGQAFFHSPGSKGQAINLDLSVVLGPVQNSGLMDRLFQGSGPQVVFHAAAYKHVPMMEDHPWEAVFNNVVGTRCVLEACDRHQVERFVLVSTDKAVRPTSVMGATKRVGEMLVRAFAAQSKTLFMAVRFGNVVGSAGSVVPLFRKQIERGGPVTVTHPDITRFFMTIPEACGLILQAGAIGHGGEIFVLKMGTPIRIADMAADIITLHGYTPGKEIEITFTGLRPGEKLHEELVFGDEGTGETLHKDILVLPGNGGPNLEILDSWISRLVVAAMEGEGRAIKSQLQKMVPEYEPERVSFD